MNIPLDIAPPDPHLHKEYIACENGTICRCPLILPDRDPLDMVVLEESSDELRAYVDRHLATWASPPEDIIVTATKSPWFCCQIDFAVYPVVGHEVLPIGVPIGKNILGLKKP